METKKTYNGMKNAVKIKNYTRYCIDQLNARTVADYNQLCFVRALYENLPKTMELLPDDDDLRMSSCDPYYQRSMAKYLSTQLTYVNKKMQEDREEYEKLISTNEDGVEDYVFSLQMYKIFNQ